MYQQRSVASVIIFSIITCGIYALYWYYITTKDLNTYLGVSDMDAGIELLILIVFPPYAIYWFYKYAKRASDALVKAGQPMKDDSVICLILCIFGLGIVSIGIMQSTLNEVYSAA